MTAMVADASVVVKCVLPESGSWDAMQLMGRARPVLAPGFVYCECANVIWKQARRGAASRQEAETALEDVLSLPMRIIDDSALTPAALSIALEHDHPVYDCYYLAAAILHDCALATADERLYQLAVRVGLGERAILVR